MLPIKMLTEAFSPSKNPRTAFWDFYALYLLWFKVEGWRGAYKNGVITNEKRVEYIRNMFWTATVNQAEYLLKGLMKFIPEEMSNLYNEYLVNPESVKAWGHDNRTIYNKLLALAPPDSKLSSPYMRIDQDEPLPSGRFWELLTVPEVCKVFMAPFWREDSDLYGGQPWAAITERFGKLLEAFKRKNMDTLAMEIDHTYDLDHNTGSISSKFPPNKSVPKGVLDQRASIRTMEDFIPLVSPAVAAVLKRSVQLGEAVSLKALRKAVSLVEGVTHTVSLAEILKVSN